MPRHKIEVHNRADGVDGHFCVAKEIALLSCSGFHPGLLTYSETLSYYEFWNKDTEKWTSAGSVYMSYEEAITDATFLSLHDL